MILVSKAQAGFLILSLLLGSSSFAQSSDSLMKQHIKIVKDRSGEHLVEPLDSLTFCESLYSVKPPTNFNRDDTVGVSEGYFIIIRVEFNGKGKVANVVEETKNKSIQPTVNSIIDIIRHTNWKPIKTITKEILSCMVSRKGIKSVMLSTEDNYLTHKCCD